MNIPRGWRTDSGAEYSGSRSVFTGISNTRGSRPFLPVPRVPPNVPGSIERRFYASRLLQAGSNGRKFRKAGLEIRESVADGVFIRPARVIVAAADAILVLARLTGAATSCLRRWRFGRMRLTERADLFDANKL